MKRHDLVFVCLTAWQHMLETHGDLAGDPLVAGWVDSGWPLIGRRSLCNEAQGVALGLPLPPFAGKRRLAFLLQPAEILSITPPPALDFAGQAAPPAWQPALEALGELASQHSLEVRVFGSLAWRALTGLDYLTASSDLDVLLHIRRDTDLQRLAADVAAIETAAPMRLDGEFVRNDGAAVNWREIRAGARELLVKTVGGVEMLDTRLFSGGVSS